MFAGDDPLALLLAELDDQAAARTRRDHDQLGHDVRNAAAPMDAGALVDLDAWLATDPLATFPPADALRRPDYLATPPLELSSPSTASATRRLDAADLAGLDLVCPDLALLLLDAQPAATASLASPTTSVVGSRMGTNATEPKLDESAAAAGMTMNNARSDDQASLDALLHARADTVSWHSNCTDAGHVEIAAPAPTIAAAPQRTSTPQFHESVAVAAAQPAVQVAPGPITTGHTNSVPLAPPVSTVPVALPPLTASAPTAPTPPAAPSTTPAPAPAPRITISALMSLRHLAANSASSYRPYAPSSGGAISGYMPPSAPFPLITTPPALPPTPTPSPPAQTVPAGPRVIGGKVLRPVLPRPTAPPPPPPPRFPTPYAVYWPGATVPGAAPVRPTYVTAPVVPVQRAAMGTHPTMPMQHPTNPMTVPHAAIVQHPAIVQHTTLAQHATATMHYSPPAVPTTSAPAKKPISCVHCRASHVACPGLRPCARCVRLGRADTCVDYIPKRQLASSSSTPTPAPAAKRRKRAGTASATCSPPPPPESVALAALTEPPIPRAAAGGSAAARWGG
ncbi:hypothetical protein GGF32_003221 [Allomyces javanicus]|nr:hypothetical protein GGF32_003221 [Allomyces javanicus]